MKISLRITPLLIVPLVLTPLGCKSDSGASGDEHADEGTGSESGHPPEKFDVGLEDDVPDGGGDCEGGGGGGEVEFSYIWIANSTEGTVSKIDTRTLDELGRYIVGPNPSLKGGAGPSRTSVNLSGDVAVNDRDGGLLKILARPEQCPELQNGQAGLQTSQGAQDVLAWGEDDCVAWRLDLPVDARPAAWTRGEQLDACTYAPAEVWTAAPNEDDSGAATVYLVGGETGKVVDQVEIAAEDCNCPQFGLYGGAVDRDNDLWTFPRDGMPHGSGPLVEVDYESMTYALHPKPDGMYAYGITVDRDGRVWIAGDGSSVGHYDPGSDQWTVIDPGLPDDKYVLRGLMQDEEGDIWVAAVREWTTPASLPPGLLRIDGGSDTVIDFLDDETLTGLLIPAGVSIDVDGYVWLVDTAGEQAYRIDPANYAFDVVSGLVKPYTYSDMTGFGLNNVHMPPTG